MDFLINGLSIHGQFYDIISFRNAIQQVLTIRAIVRRFGRALYCDHNLLCSRVTVDKTMQEVLQALSRDERGALIRWLTQHGPFWDDLRQHGPDDWIECSGEIVTDRAIGEAAWCCLNGIERGVVSIAPSRWQFSPIPIVWVTETTGRAPIDVVNHWDPIAFEGFLQALPVVLVSWENLEELARNRFTRLTFSMDAFTFLNGHPFALSAAERLLSILHILDRFKSCFNESGQRTAEGHQIYRDFFTGQKGEGGRGPLFTDSSKSEKSDFKEEMTFKHPQDSSKSVFYPWHGKVQTPPLRVHFSWPVRADEPLFIVYVGPKLTRR